MVVLDPDHPGARHRLAALGGRPAPDRAPDDYVETLFDATRRGLRPAPRRARRPGARARRGPGRRGPGPAGGSSSTWQTSAAARASPGHSSDRGRAPSSAATSRSNMLRLRRCRGCYDVLHRRGARALPPGRAGRRTTSSSGGTRSAISGDLGPATTTAAAWALRPGRRPRGDRRAAGRRVGDWRLTSSGRYAHGEEYLRTVCGRRPRRTSRATLCAPPPRSGCPGRGTAVVGATTRHGERSEPCGRGPGASGQGATTARAEGRMGG